MTELVKPNLLLCEPCKTICPSAEALIKHSKQDAHFLKLKAQGQCKFCQLCQMYYFFDIITKQFSAHDESFNHKWSLIIHLLGNHKVLANKLRLKQGSRDVFEQNIGLLGIDYVVKCVNKNGCYYICYLCGYSPTLSNDELQELSIINHVQSKTHVHNFFRVNAPNLLQIFHKYYDVQVEKKIKKQTHSSEFDKNMLENVIDKIRPQFSAHLNKPKVIRYFYINESFPNFDLVSHIIETFDNYSKETQSVKTTESGRYAKNEFANHLGSSLKQYINLEFALPRRKDSLFKASPIESTGSINGNFIVIDTFTSKVVSDTDNISESSFDGGVTTNNENPVDVKDNGEKETSGTECRQQDTPPSDISDSGLSLRSVNETSIHKCLSPLLTMLHAQDYQDSFLIKEGNNAFFELPGQPLSLTDNVNDPDNHDINHSPISNPCNDEEMVAKVLFQALSKLPEPKDDDEDFKVKNSMLGALSLLTASAITTEIAAAKNPPSETLRSTTEPLIEDKNIKHRPEVTSDVQLITPPKQRVSRKGVVHSIIKETDQSIAPLSVGIKSKISSHAKTHPPKVSESGSSGKGSTSEKIVASKKSYHHYDPKHHGEGNTVVGDQKDMPEQTENRGDESKKETTRKRPSPYHYRREHNKYRPSTHRGTRSTSKRRRELDGLNKRSSRYSPKRHKPERYSPKSNLLITIPNEKALDERSGVLLDRKNQRELNEVFTQIRDFLPGLPEVDMTREDFSNTDTIQRLFDVLNNTLEAIFGYWSSYQALDRVLDPGLRLEIGTDQTKLTRKFKDGIEAGFLRDKYIDNGKMNRFLHRLRDVLGVMARYYERAQQNEQANSQSRPLLDVRPGLNLPPVPSQPLLNDYNFLPQAPSQHQPLLSRPPPTHMPPPDILRSYPPPFPPAIYHQPPPSFPPPLPNVFMPQSSQHQQHLLLSPLPPMLLPPYGRDFSTLPPNLPNQPLHFSHPPPYEPPKMNHFNVVGGEKSSLNHIPQEGGDAEVRRRGEVWEEKRDHRTRHEGKSSRRGRSSSSRHGRSGRRNHSRSRVARRRGRRSRRHRHHSPSLRDRSSRRTDEKNGSRRPIDDSTKAPGGNEGSYKGMDSYSTTIMNKMENQLRKLIEVQNSLLFYPQAADESLYGTGNMLQKGADSSSIITAMSLQSQLNELVADKSASDYLSKPGNEGVKRLLQDALKTQVRILEKYQNSLEHQQHLMIFNKQPGPEPKYMPSFPPSFESQIAELQTLNQNLYNQPRADQPTIGMNATFSTFLQPKGFVYDPMLTAVPQRNLKPKMHTLTVNEVKYPKLEQLKPPTKYQNKRNTAANIAMTHTHSSDFSRPGEKINSDNHYNLDHNKQNAVATSSDADMFMAMNESVKSTRNTGYGSFEGGNNFVSSINDKAIANEYYRSVEYNKMRDPSVETSGAHRAQQETRGGGYDSNSGQQSSYSLDYVNADKIVPAYYTGKHTKDAHHSSSNSGYTNFQHQENRNNLEQYPQAMAAKSMRVDHAVPGNFERYFK